MSAVLTEYHGVGYRPVGYCSKRLDSAIRGMVSCLRSVAAAIEAVLSCSDVAIYPLTVHVPHAVHAIITQARTTH